MNINKITWVKEGDARAAFAYIFPQFIKDRRRLSSIAFHLAIEIDISNSTEDQLLIGIGSDFVRRYGVFLPESYKGMPIKYDFDSEDYVLFHKMASSPYLPENEFDFLMEFDPKSIRFKLNGQGIFSDLIARNAFMRGGKKEVVLGYLFDISDLPVSQITRKLSKLRDTLHLMKFAWEKNLSWFDNSEKIKAAIFYSGKIIKDTPANQISMITQENLRTPLMPAVDSVVDLEIFFHDHRCPSIFKKFVFDKISGLYNTRTSRKENKEKNKKKSCSFILTKEAESLIKEIAKENKVKGSALLNAVFQKHNKAGLQSLFKNFPFLNQR